MSKQKDIYPYLLLIACAGIIGVTFGLANIQGLFFDSISKELNIGKGVTAFYVTLIHIAGAIFAPIGVKLRKRFSVRQIMLVDGLIVLVALILLPRVNSIYLIYICAFLIGAGQGIYGHTMVVELIAKWFKRAGTAIGFAMCASGIFGSVFSPIIVNSIVKYGWRKAYLIFPITVAVVLVYSLIVIKDKPENYENKENKKENKNVFCKEVVYVACFYLFTSSMTSIGGYLLTYSGDVGLTMSQGSLLSSTINIGNLVLKLIFGYLCDEIGGLKTCLIAYGLISAGSLILIICPSNLYSILVIGTFLLGASFSGSNVLTSSICRDVFGSENISDYYATITAFSVISSFSSTIIGFVYDLTDSLKYSIFGFEALISISIVLIYITIKRKRG